LPVKKIPITQTGQARTKKDIERG